MEFFISNLPDNNSLSKGQNHDRKKLGIVFEANSVTHTLIIKTKKEDVSIESSFYFQIK